MSAPAAARSVEDVRNHWRSLIVDTILKHAALLALVPPQTRRYTDLPDPPLRDVTTLAKELLDWACAAELRERRHPRAIWQRIDGRLWDFLKAYSTRWAENQRAQTSAQQRLL